MVRLHFQENPWDLYAAVGYTVVMGSAMLATGEGSLVGILVVLFAPGYVSVATLFPNSVTPTKPAIDWIERIALSFAISIAVVPVLGLLLNSTPWGIGFAPTVVTITLFTVVVGLVAYWRRMRLPPDLRLSAALDLVMPRWGEYSLFDKCTTIALSLGIVVSGVTLAYILETPRPGKTFTDFYILGPGGNASGYPTALNVSQIGSVVLGIANHEAANVNYTVHIDLVGVRIVHNATSGFNETVEINRTTWSTINVTLADGQTWISPYMFRIDYTGLWKVQLFLFRDGDFSSAYRDLHLFIHVT